MQKYSIVLGLLLTGVIACQSPVSQQSLQNQQTLDIPGRLILQTADKRQLVLGQALLQVFAGQSELAKVSVLQNLFRLPLLKQVGPYTYQGQGTIERIQYEAVPIGGSQGGAVPIGGSQGGLRSPGFETLDIPDVAPGQTIRFTGQISEDLTQALPQLDLRVPADKITLVANQAIVNVNSDVTNSAQVVIPGNTQGNVNINNGLVSSNRPPVIKMAGPVPLGPIAPGATTALEAEAQDPDGDSLQYFWRAERGTLSSDRGQRVNWTAQDTKGSLPASVQIELTVKDPNGGSDTAKIGLVIQPAD